MQKSSVPTDFLNNVNEARAQLEKKGFAVVDAADTDRETLLAWASHFGQIQNHPKAGTDGIVDLITNRSEIGGQFDRSRASVSSEFLPHSDGAFVDGLLVKSGVTRQVGPPSLFLLQCVTAAEEGGESLIIDCQTIFEDLRRESPQIFSFLTRPILSFCGGADYSLNKSLFERLSPDRWRVRFRSDLLMIEQSARSAVQSFFQDYVLNPKYHQVFPLKSGQILIADNFRLLHGRKQIEANEGAPRHVRRLWIWDPEVQSHYVTLEGKTMPTGAFPNGGKYDPLPLDTSEISPSPLALGIRGGEKFQTWDRK
jgi:alpha-ketoglutarate-dependent taurine dioxygenase